ncbi:MAG: MauE/DoxX family redox-associated membrane protein [Alcaligenes aquatilis]
MRQKRPCKFSFTQLGVSDMDPVLTYASLACLAVLMGLGALDKLRHFSLFEAAVGGYRLLPEMVLRPFSVLFVAAEALSAPLLLWPASRSLGAILALCVLLVATSGIVMNLLRGRRDVDCGCSGLGESSGGLSWWLVARNALLAALAVASGDWAISSARELVWVDGLTFFGATLALLGLYYAANQLIESHLKFQKMQNS